MTERSTRDSSRSPEREECRLYREEEDTQWPPTYTYTALVSWVVSEGELSSSS